MLRNRDRQRIALAALLDRQQSADSVEKVGDRIHGRKVRV
jgi:hypothetical protein